MDWKPQHSKDVIAPKSDTEYWLISYRSILWPTDVDNCGQNSVTVGIDREARHATAHGVAKSQTEQQQKKWKRQPMNTPTPG